MSDNYISSLIEKGAKNIQQVLPGEDNLPIHKKLIFIIFILYILCYISNINLANYLPENISDILLNIFNNKVLNLISYILAAFGFIFIFSVIIEESFVSKKKKHSNKSSLIKEILKELSNNLKSDEKEQFTSRGLGIFVEWLSSYFTLYFLSFLTINNKSVLSVFFNIDNELYNLYWWLNVSLWFLLLLLIIYIVLSVLRSVFFTIHSFDIYYQLQHQKTTIIKPALTSMYSDLKKNPNLSYIDQKKKTLEIIEMELELQKNGHTIHSIEEEINE